MVQALRSERSSAVDRAVGELRRALFAGEIAPGTPLREVALSESMGVARSTIREALSVLVSDGMAVRVTHKGVAVRELTEGDVHDVIRARAALEGAGLQRWTTASARSRSEPRRALEVYVSVARQTADAGRLTEAHLKIHRAFVGLTGSDRLLAASDSLAAEVRLGLAHLDRIRGNVEDQIADHARLIELLERGAVEDAVAELNRHLGAAEQSLLAATRHGTIDP